METVRHCTPRPLQLGGKRMGDRDPGGGAPPPPRPFSFSVDRGGTFTDVYGHDSSSNATRVLKLLSCDPANYPDAPREGIRRLLEAFTGTPHARDDPLVSDDPKPSPLARSTGLQL